MGHGCVLSECHDKPQLQSSDTRAAWAWLCGMQVKMGVWQGRPTRISPHATSGRADVYGEAMRLQGCTCVALCCTETQLLGAGPLVNRWGCLPVVARAAGL